ncbi:Wzz/FepE/Etk N-terminal domain-containing protein [Oribacterium sp. P6A1]|uniref:Wzz/FepE/Etk N-terminal domain-containing protein n=1 Tax=Oribacterium sp. P6A1 TaxID=1410612 RepID=UPI000567018D|nr:Wzz/FepE/Etk N-terminal domain-containing protein [Oribacterium sp. P6A1]
MFKNELEIDVFRCIRTLIAKIWFIAIITVLFFIIGLGLTLDVGRDKYTSVATVYAAADGSYTDASNAVTVMNAYLDVATSYKVSQRAALLLGRNDIDAQDVRKALTAASSAKSGGSSVTNFMTNSATIITLYATTDDPELSREMADAAAESYIIEMSNILKSDAVKSLDNAERGELSHNAEIEAWKKRITFMLIGFALSCLIVVSCEVFDRKVRTVREATIRGQIPVIGVIPDYKE